MQQIPQKSDYRNIGITGFREQDLRHEVSIHAGCRRFAGPTTYAELDLYVPTFERAFPVEIRISNGSSVVSDKTLQTVGEIASLPQEARACIQTLLYEDALRASTEVAYSDPNPAPEVPPSGFFRRIFWRPTKYRFVPLSLDDPRHPCCLVNGHQSVEAKIEWLRFRIDEDESLTHRFALFDCRPAWEERGARSLGCLSRRRSRRCRRT